MQNIADSSINDYLNAKGIPNRGKGRAYLMEAVRRQIDNPIEKLMALYAETGKPHGQTFTRVERNIRHAIETSSVESVKDLSNGEFIAKAVNDLRYGT